MTQLVSVNWQRQMGSGGLSIKPQFHVLSPRPDGTIDVEPLKGTDSATFTRATVAMVRQWDNTYVEVPSGTSRIQGARYSGGVFYTDTGDGTPLHPTVSKKGANVLARYATRPDNTALALGDRRIWGTGGTAGGAGWVQEITTAGTTAGSAPTQNETIGGTTSDGTATWTNKGHYKLAGYLGEPAAENVILQSRAFDTTWTSTGTVQTQDQDGIDGVANTAWQLEDNSGAAFEFIDQPVTISADSNTHTFSIYILKDSDTSRFPGIGLTLTGGGGSDARVLLHVNTQTGASVEVDTGGTYTSNVEDHGLWWRVVLTATNNGTEITAAITLYPAVASSIGTNSTAATGTTIFDQAQLELNTSVPSSPIITTTASVTRAADSDVYQSANNLDDSVGTALLSWTPEYTAHSVTKYIFVAGGSARFFYQTNGAVNYYDGTNAVQILNSFVNGKTYNLGITWEGSVIKAYSNGVLKVTGAFDGQFNTATDLEIGGQGAGNDDQSSISDARIYKKVFDQAIMEDLTSYD